MAIDKIPTEELIIQLRKAASVWFQETDMLALEEIFQRVENAYKTGHDDGYQSGRRRAKEEIFQRLENAYKTGYVASQMNSGTYKLISDAKNAYKTGHDDGYQSGRRRALEEIFQRLENAYKTGYASPLSRIMNSGTYKLISDAMRELGYSKG